MPEDPIAEEYERLEQDRPVSDLGVEPPFWHTTMSLEAVQASGKLLSRGELARLGTEVRGGFGHASYADASHQISLTYNDKRAGVYFDNQVFLVAVATEQVDVSAWLGWYLERFDNLDSLLQSIATDFTLEANHPLQDALRSLGLDIDFKPSEFILTSAVTQLQALSGTERLQWLLELDAHMMKQRDAERGLGVVEPDAASWTGARVEDIALLQVEVSAEAIGHLHRPEHELRVRDCENTISVVRDGPTRLAEWPWKFEPAPTPDYGDENE